MKFLKNYKFHVRYQQPKAHDDQVEKVGLAFPQAAATGKATDKASEYDSEDVSCYRCGKRHRLKNFSSLSKVKKKAAYDAHNKQVAAAANKTKSGVANLNVDKEK